MVGTGKGAEHGILIKSGQALETAHNINTVVLDKTGTITQGKPMVTDIHTIYNDVHEFITIAAALEQNSEHPLAEAVMHYADEQNIRAAVPQDFLALPGRGVQAMIGDKPYYAGNKRLMDENNIDLSSWAETLEQLASAGKTPLIFSDDTQVIGIIGAADVVKPTSYQAIHQLKEMGVQVIMLTGDNARTAAAIQQQLDLDEVIAEVLPQDKEQQISALQADGKIVAMVGDGVNDAPALARADVGLAIGAGTDVALESADIVLMKNDLLDVVTAIQLSKATIRNIKQNLFWAFFYNVLCIPLAAGLYYNAFGILLNPMIGAAAMSCSSFFVVTNALRLRGFKPVLAQSSEQIAQPEHHEVQIITSIGNAGAQPSADRTELPVTRKTMIIEGMMCPHCQKAVTQALCALDGVNATVSLENKAAYITSTGITSDEDMIKAVTNADYKVISLTDDEPVNNSSDLEGTNNSKGVTLMKKTMIIEGMMCPHCQKAVTKALNDLEGVSATVSLEDKAAYITTDGTTSDEAMIKAVTDGDYKVISLTDAE